MGLRRQIKRKALGSPKLDESEPDTSDAGESEASEAETVRDGEVSEQEMESGNESEISLGDEAVQEQDNGWEEVRRKRQHPARRKMKMQPIRDLDIQTVLLYTLDKNVQLQDISKAAVQKEFAARKIRPVKVRTIRDGLALDFAKGGDINEALKIDSLAGRPVVAKLPSDQQPKTPKGTASGKYGTNEEFAELYYAEETNPEIENVARIGTSNTYTITFKEEPIPDQITLFYTKIRVAPYYREPLKCFNCHRYGHVKKVCKQKGACRQCGSPNHELNKCNAPEDKLWCVNCGEKHPASSKVCSHRIFEIKLAREKATGASWKEAHDRVLAKNKERKVQQKQQTSSETAGKRTYADAVGTRPNTSRQIKGNDRETEDKDTKSKRPATRKMKERSGNSEKQTSGDASRPMLQEANVEKRYTKRIRNTRVSPLNLITDFLARLPPILVSMQDKPQEALQALLTLVNEVFQAPQESRISSSSKGTQSAEHE